jgi:[histone H3]-dimethyl-L-lysine9 demethylase
MEPYLAHQMHLVVVGALLELKCLFKEKFIAELLEKADSALNNEMEVKIEGSKCPCFTESGDMDDGISWKSSCRENSCDNYIYCPTATNVQNGSLDHFQEHWLKGEPVHIGREIGNGIRL